MPSSLEKEVIAYGAGIHNIYDPVVIVNNSRKKITPTAK